MKMLSGNIAVGLWVLATTIMCVGLFGHVAGAYEWGQFLGLVALGFTTWVLSERRDHMRDRSVEHVIEVVEALNKGRGETRRHLH